MKNFLACLVTVAIATAAVLLVYNAVPFVKLAKSLGMRDCDRAGYCAPQPETKP